MSQLGPPELCLAKGMNHIFEPVQQMWCPDTITVHDSYTNSVCARCSFVRCELRLGGDIVDYAYDQRTSLRRRYEKQEVELPDADDLGRLIAARRLMLTAKLVKADGVVAQRRLSLAA